MALRAMFPFQTRALAPMGGGDPFLTLHRELNRVFDDVFRSSSGTPAAAAAMVPMHMDVTEDEKAIRIVAELPGVSENDIQVELNDDVLTIRGEKRSQYEDAQHHVRERMYGAFSRSIQLPFAADPNRLEAGFANGVLTVTVPKEAAQQQVHRIQIRPGASGQSGGQSGGGQSGGVQAGSGKPASGQSGSGAGKSG